MPGDPVSALIAKNQGRISPDAAEALRALFGLDEDIVAVAAVRRLLEAAAAAATSASSFTYFPTPVADVIRQALPWTIGLVGIATIISFTIGTLVGTGIGWRRGTWADALLPISTFFSAVPYFWLALIAISLFSVTLGWFPASGSYDRSLVPDALVGVHRLRHLLRLPAGA